MIVRPLGDTDFDLIIECFLKAFENYYVKMPTDHNYYKQRWNAAKVNYNLSYGMFDKDRLVGFIIHAIDKRDTHHIAFNTGTGVIPAYRGKKIVKSIFEFAIPDLKRNGVTKSVLEVIIKNEKAIKAYKEAEFEICKTFKCYAGELIINELQVKVEEILFDSVSWDKIPNQDKYSWDFHYRCLKDGISKYFNVYNDAVIESFFSIKPDGTINQLEVLDTSREKHWERLFSAIQSVSKQVRIINVDDTLKDKLCAIERFGLANTVNQYEMALFL